MEQDVQVRRAACDAVTFLVTADGGNTDVARYMLTDETMTVELTALGTLLPVAGGTITT